MKKMIDEFQEFIATGNALDLAIGVVFGGAFGAIVNSMVDDILMPLVGLILGGTDISGWHFMVGTAVVRYGAFIQAIVNFLIIAFFLFLIVKTVNIMRKKEEVVTEEPPKPEDIVLLEQIRDLLEKK